MANAPKAANVATEGLPTTLSPMANIAGITMAARAARRSAARSRSRRASHSIGPLWSFASRQRYDLKRGPLRWWQGLYPRRARSA